MKTIFSRWLPSVATTPTRKAVLGVAGVALAAAALTGAAHGLGSPADTAPTAHTAAVAAATIPTSPALASVKQIAPTAPAKAAAAPAAPAAPAKAAAPAPAPAKEKAVGYDFKLQPNYYFCGPAATRIALSALGQNHSFDELANELGTTTDGTNSAFDIVRVLNANLGGNVYHAVEIPGQAATASQINKLKNDVVGAITSNHPLVGNVAGAATDVSGHEHNYPGHYLAIVGYGHNGNTVKIADPADTDGSGSYWMSTAAAANWMATHGYAVN